MHESLLPYAEAIQIVKEKHERIPVVMKKHGIECWLTFIRETSANPDPVQELIIGGDVVWQSAFIFYVKNEVTRKIAIVGNFDAQAEKEKGIWDEVIPYTQGITEPLRAVIKELKPEKIAINYSMDDVMADGLSHGMYLLLEQILPSFKGQFISARDLIMELRSQKTQTEIELIKQACKITETINEVITKYLKTGLTEIEIQNMFYKEMEKQGVKEAWQRNSCPAVDAGPEKEFGHAGATSNQVKKGFTLHNDFGVVYHGYCSDLQRMWFFGTKDEVPDELRHAFETVKGAIRKAKDFIRPGVKGWEVDKIARDYVKQRGYDEFQHALGHQVGRKAHDGGILLGPRWERYGELPNGMIQDRNVFTLELYVTTKNYGMVSLEEMIIVTENGAEFLTPPVEDFIYISS